MKTMMEVKKRSSKIPKTASKSKANVGSSLSDSRILLLVREASLFALHLPLSLSGPSTSKAKQGSMWTMRSIIQHGAPYMTLTVLTSLALNRALLARARREEATQHTQQQHFLRSLLSSPPSLFLTSEEELRLSRRARALGLDPTHLCLPPAPAAPGEERHTSWRSIFLGDGEKASEGVKKAAGSIGQMLRQGGFPIKEEGVREQERAQGEEEEWLDGECGVTREWSGAGRLGQAGQLMLPETALLVLRRSCERMLTPLTFASRRMDGSQLILRSPITRAELRQRRRISIFTRARSSSPRAALCLSPIAATSSRTGASSSGSVFRVPSGLCSTGKATKADVHLAQAFL